MKVFDNILSWIILAISAWNLGSYIAITMLFEINYPLWIDILMIFNTIITLVYGDIIPIKKNNGD